MAAMTSLAERIDIVESSEAGEATWRISRRYRNLPFLPRCTCGCSLWAFPCTLVVVVNQQTRE